MTASTVITDYLKIFAGTPTGIPPVNVGTVALGWDDTNKLLYAYSWTAAAWRAVGSSGSSFSPFYDGAVINPASNIPAIGSFTVTKNGTLGAGGSSSNLTMRGISLVVPETVSGSDNVMKAKQAVASTTALTVDALLHMDGISNNSSAGLFIEDGTGKYTKFVVTGQSGATISNFLFQGNYTSGDAFSSTGVIGNLGALAPPAVMWMRLKITGGNLIWYTSHDGETWLQRQSVAVGSYLGTPVNVGLIATRNTGSAPNNTWSTLLDCYSWRNVTP